MLCSLKINFAMKELFFRSIYEGIPDDTYDNICSKYVPITIQHFFETQQPLRDRLLREQQQASPPRVPEQRLLALEGLLEVA